MTGRKTSSSLFQVNKKYMMGDGWLGGDLAGWVS